MALYVLHQADVDLAFCGQKKWLVFLQMCIELPRQNGSRPYVSFFKLLNSNYVVNLFQTQKIRLFIYKNVKEDITSAFFYIY